MCDLGLGSSILQKCNKIYNKSTKDTVYEVNTSTCTSRYNFTSKICYVDISILNNAYSMYRGTYLLSLAVS